MLQNLDIAAIRKDYTLKEFDESHVNPNPFAQFKVWFNEAIDAAVNEPNAMTLATASLEGLPSARIVLLKGIEEDGFIFYTNYLSNKGKQIALNPHAALLFFWPELQRQVRIEGIIAKTAAHTADEYFASRPMESKIGAHASAQSAVLGSRKELEEEFERLKELFTREPLLRPENWGGFKIIPEKMEFWQGRASRLHDRFEFTRTKAEWQFVRLSP
jgi:pyridoxamine 5'-phosphate oxidase